MIEYPEAQIIQNTELYTLDLVPELPIRLLRLTGPWCEHNCGAWADDITPYWAFSWAAGQGLARYLLDHPELVAGKRVFDFGSGCGLASIAAAKSGAVEVIASDIDPNAAIACRLSSAHNNVTVTTVVAELGPPDLSHCDVLLASDVFFHWAENQRILTSDAAPAITLVAMPHKRGFIPQSEFPMDQLQILAEYEVKTVPTIERPDIKFVSVYRVKNS